MKDPTMRKTTARTGQARNWARWVAGFTLSLSLGHYTATAAEAPVTLGTTTQFAVLAGSGITIAGAVNTTTITGDIGSFPTPAITGLGNVVLNGVNHSDDAVTQTAKDDLVTAYNDAAGRPTGFTVATELGGTTVPPGVYDSASGTFGITGTLTLDGLGDPNAVFIFKTASTLITASASQVVLIGGANACNVYWQVGSSATLATDSTFKGTILALTSITMNTRASLEGRALARNGAVTLDANQISNVCGGSFSLGNRVFLDDGSGGGITNNGFQDGTEPGLSDVVLRLFVADAAGSPEGPVLDSQTTDLDGWYRFDAVTAGRYVVVVDVPASFVVLNGLYNSTGASVDTSLTGDLFDHGVDTLMGLGTVLPGGIASVPVTLGSALQPLSEATASGAGAHGPDGDASDNLVLDFGFNSSPLALASIVSVTAHADAGVVTVRWVTVAEIGTVSYLIQRAQLDGSWLAVNPDPVFAWNSIIGGAYAVVDASARARQNYQYQILEYMENGDTKAHGPYAVTVTGEPGLPVTITSLVLDGGQLRLTWQGEAGATYLLERSPSLGEDAAWLAVPLSTPDATSVATPMTDAAGFFRLFRIE